MVVSTQGKTQKFCAENPILFLVAESVRRLLEELAKSLFLIRMKVGGHFPDEFAPFAQIFDSSSASDSYLAFIDVMFAILKLEEVSGKSIRKVARLETFHVSGFKLVSFLPEHPGRGPGTTTKSAVACSFTFT